MPSAAPSRRTVLAAPFTLVLAPVLLGGLLGGVAGCTGPSAAAGPVDPRALRDRIRAATPAHRGTAVATARLGLPAIPQLEAAATLLTSTTRVRTFVSADGRRRADELLAVGERGVYVDDDGEVAWDFDADQVTVVDGTPPARLPRAGDLLPPELAGRLLALGAADEPTATSGRRIAGRDAVGLRLAPADPATTVGAVDVWVDPTTALPLAVAVSARTGPPVLTTEFTDVVDGEPDPATLRPPFPGGAGVVAASAADVAGALRVLDAPAPPARLAGRDRVALAGSDALPGVALYGGGLGSFALVPTTREIAERAIDAAGLAGGTAVDVGAGRRGPVRAATLATPLLSVGVRTRGPGGALLVGPVTPAVLAAALDELSADRA